MILDIESNFNIYKLGDALFQISDFFINLDYLKHINFILNLGNKFVPNYFFNNIEFFNYLIKDIDLQILEFNKNMILYNEKKSSINKIENNILDNKYINKLFIFLKDKSNIDPKKFKINKEVNIFRNIIQNNLFEEFKNIKIDPNINKDQLNCLIKFQKEKPFKIVNCDKNVGNAILSNELYLKEVNQFISSDNTYLELDNNPLDLTINSINFIILELYLNKHISKKLKNLLMLKQEKCKLGKFKLLAKLHKKKFSWRPIINCQNSPTEKICKLIDYILKPIVTNTETYIKDSQNLIQKTENICFEKKPFLYSLDFESLYSNILPEHAINLITNFLIGKINNDNIDILAINKFLKLIFNNNIFTCNKKYYKQNKGLSMG